MSWRFFVPGVPAPKGSSRAFFVKALGRAVITNANAKTKPWEQAVRAEAANAMRGGSPTMAPIVFGVEFLFARPKGHFRANGAVKPGAPMRHTKKPDLDKLVRAMLDAATGLLFVDDSQVFRLGSCEKRYVSDGEVPGALVTVDAEVVQVAADDCAAVGGAS